MIKEFKGEYSWLSNFAPCEIEVDGFMYKSVENAYQSAKNDSRDWKETCSFETAGDTKNKSKTIALKENWEQIKFNVMLDCLLQKFYQNPYKSELLNTNDEEIQEGNWWGDKYWGVCLKTGEGKNTLGKLIMIIRQLLKLKNE